jgi:enoyl-CoA hydratase/carnithine racemase
MLSMLSRRFMRYLYSNIKLDVSKEQNTAFLTLANPKKRNPLALVTIKELQSALKEV